MEARLCFAGVSFLGCGAPININAGMYSPIHHRVTPVSQLSALILFYSPFQSQD